MKPLRGRKQKVYELTTNERDGYAKWYVKGIKDDAEAKKVALAGFGKKFAEPKLISYYDDYPSKYKENNPQWRRAPGKRAFIKLANKEYGVGVKAKPTGKTVSKGAYISTTKYFG